MNPGNLLFLIIPTLGTASLVATLVMGWRSRYSKSVYFSAFFVTILMASVLAARKSRMVGEDAFSLFTALNVIFDYSFIGVVTLVVAVIIVVLRGNTR